ncbi:CCA tRNA nucleotidyltransferase [Candidatus Woesearchaeota archaeon]|nr:MAG: CCA tRNA nucleotidyltransferase [Candidatus Woesearchaeota archaeon]
MPKSFKSPVLKEILMDLKKEILPKLEPDKEQVKRAQKLVKEIQKLIDDAQIQAEVMLGGSLAKGTNLKGDHDIDIFVRFDYERYKDKDISELLEQALSPLAIERVHGSRDYFHLKQDVNVEIVPVLKVDDPAKAKNVTDMSPLHVAWVQKHKRYAGDIRLAKQFCKAARVYGAESYIGGFSGHVLDILVITYKGFENLLKASQKWKDKEIIDPLKRNLTLEDFNKSKTDSPIIVVDPILADRNAAAALTKEKYEMFREAAAKFLKKPTKSAFIIKPFDLEKIKKKYKTKKVVCLEIEPLEGKTDVVGAKIMKAIKILRNQLKFHDFEILNYGWNWKEGEPAKAFFVFPAKNLEPVSKRCGPPLEETERVANFKKKHKQTFEENGRICTYVKRAFTDPKKLISHLIKTDDLLKSKAKRIKLC